MFALGMIGQDKNANVKDIIKVVREESLFYLERKSK